ncbi:MAG: hypothetical protein K9G47_11290 [Bacteroidales bacterium]|nr:hypothetical protein [Bacteroidales bacterium]
MIKSTPDEVRDEALDVLITFAKKKEALEKLEKKAENKKIVITEPIATTVDHLIDPDKDLDQQIGEILEYEMAKRDRLKKNKDQS